MNLYLFENLELSKTFISFKIIEVGLWTHNVRLKNNMGTLPNFK